MIEKINEAINVTLDPADNKEHYSKTWRYMRSIEPDAVYLLGDNVYNDGVYPSSPCRCTHTRFIPHLALQALATGAPTTTLSGTTSPQSFPTRPPSSCSCTVTSPRAVRPALSFTPTSTSSRTRCQTKVYPLRPFIPHHMVLFHRCTTGLRGTRRFLSCAPPPRTASM